MHYRSVLSYQAITRFIFRIELSKKGETDYISRKNLIQQLGESTPLFEADIYGDTAQFYWADEEDVWTTADRAQDYRRNLAFRFLTGNAAMLQIGNRGESSLVRPHLRMVFHNFRQYGNYPAEYFFGRLRAALGNSTLLPSSRLLIDEVQASFLLKGLSLGDVDVAHGANWAGAKQTVLDHDDKVCGYQFGDHLDATTKAKQSDSAYAHEETIPLETNSCPRHTRPRAHAGRLACDELEPHAFQVHGLLRVSELQPVCWIGCDPQRAGERAPRAGAVPESR